MPWRGDDHGPQPKRAEVIVGGGACGAYATACGRADHERPRSQVWAMFQLFSEGSKKLTTKDHLEVMR